MTRANEPPDWALPSWDDTTPSPSASVPESGRAGATTPAGTFGLRVLAVSEVTRAIRDLIRGDERLRDIWVEGEVGRVTISSAGHGYFNLKDDRSQLSCIWFRDDRMASPFEPRAGLRIVAHGRLDVFEPGGVYQLYVESIQPAGFGDLALRFEALKAKLAAEGLFEVARKRALPIRPAVIGVVTSPTGAVWHDIRHVIARRWPLTRVVLSPCNVQGDGAAASVERALIRLDRWADRCRADGRAGDAPIVTIIARGGGSLEDLWAFNEEAVVRAIVAHGRPVVSGIGHETDVTLADFAADVRAPTPSAAAELVVPDRADFAATIGASARRLHETIAAQLGAAGREVAAERRALDRLQPAAQLAQSRERIGALLDRATVAATSRIADARRAEERAHTRMTPLVPARVARERERLDRSARLLPILATARLAGARAGLTAAAAGLGALGPQATLDRGYAIVRRAADDRIVRDPVEAPAGSRLSLTVARGSLAATVDAPRDPATFADTTSATPPGRAS